MSQIDTHRVSPRIRDYPAEGRGKTWVGWLDSRHTFSFSGFYHPERMGFRGLRVLNDDRVLGGGGFPTHGHRDMEILSYVVEGAMEHRDSIGNGSVIRAGELQRMSAGRGIRHSEFNASETEPLRFLQIWLPPRERGLPPSYEQRELALERRRDRLRLLASPDGREGSLVIHTDALLYGSLLSAGASLRFTSSEDRGAFLQLVRGGLSAEITNDAADSTPIARSLREGDGLAVEGAASLMLSASEETELLLFDLA